MDSKNKIVSPVLANIFHSDPLASFLFRAQITPYFFVICVLAYCIFYSFILPLFFNTLSQSIQDWATLAIICIIFPLTSGYYCWQPYTIQDMYLSISKNITNEELNSNKFEMLIQPMKSRIWFYLACLIAVTQAVYFFIKLLSPPVYWQNANYVMMVAFVPIRFFSYYMIVYIIVRLIGTFVGINNFIRFFKFEINPLHPDRFGGLSGLGYYVFTTGLMIGIFGIFFGLHFLRIYSGLGDWSLEFVVELTFYSLATPALFLIPLWRAHVLMLNNKKSLLNEINEKMSAVYEESLSDLRSEQIDPENANRLGALMKLYEVTLKSPDWPLNFEMASRFIAAIAFPLIGPLGLDVASSTLYRIMLP